MTDTFSAVVHTTPVHQFGKSSGMPPIEWNAEKTGGVVRGLKIFKAGKFKDSLGRDQHFKPADLEEAVANFNKLKSKNILPNVPVRSDHSYSVDKIMGFMISMRTDGKFLYADIEITEPEAAAKYSRGTLRDRSLEIGVFEANNGDKYTNTVMGLAFVDLPAVQGLFSKPQDNTSFFTHQENDTVTVELATFRISNVPTTDVAAVQAHIDALEAAGTPKPHAFRLAGAEVSDFAAVQAHIDALAETIDKFALAERDGFVDSLVTANKITAPQAEGLKAFAKGLAPDLYSAWKVTFDTAPVVAIFNKNSGSGNGSTDNGGGDPVAEEIATLEATIAHHRRAGTSQETIEAGASWQRLQAIKAARA